MHWDLSEMRLPKVNGRLRPSDGRWVAIEAGQGTEAECIAARERASRS